MNETIWILTSVAIGLIGSTVLVINATIRIRCNFRVNTILQMVGSGLLLFNVTMPLVLAHVLHNNFWGLFYRFLEPLGLLCLGVGLLLENTFRTTRRH